LVTIRPRWEFTSVQRSAVQRPGSARPTSEFNDGAYSAKARFGTRRAATFETRVLATGSRPATLPIPGGDHPELLSGDEQFPR